MFAHNVPVLGVLHGVFALGLFAMAVVAARRAALPAGPAGVPASVGQATAI